MVDAALPVLLLLVLGEDFTGDLVICVFTLARACLALSHSGVSPSLDPSVDSEFSLFSLLLPGAAG